MPLPSVPILFLKPSTALCDPYPAPIVIPRFTQASQSADYESELAVVIGRDCKDIGEHEALSYVLGYTAGNDVSSRVAQLEQSQWSFSKGFDKASPIGAALISSASCPDPSILYIVGTKNGVVKQQSSIRSVLSCSRGTHLMPTGYSLIEIAATSCSTCPNLCRFSPRARPSVQGR